jgi:hypothetical protein
MKNIIYKFLIIAPFLTGCANGLDSELKRENGIDNGTINEDGPVEKTMLHPFNYVSWVDDKANKLKVEKTIEEFTYSFQFQPLEYIAIKDLHKAEIKETELKSKIEEYKDLQYFTFKISTESQTELLKKNLSGTDEYYGRIQYFSFDMQRDLKLIDGTDTLDCVLFHFERVFGLAPYAVFNLGFPATGKNGSKTLFYDEKIFGAGKLYLTIQSKNIKKVPSVITQ